MTKVTSLMEVGDVFLCIISMQLISSTLGGRMGCRGWGYPQPFQGQSAGLLISLFEFECESPG